MRNFWLQRKEESGGQLTICKWDFDTALGDMIREMNEPLYVKVIELQNVINRKPIPCPGVYLIGGYDIHPENYEETSDGWDVDL